MKPLASLSAVLVLAATGAAGAASAQEARIAFGDLDLSSAVGARAFDARIDSAARRICRGAKRSGSLISDRAACRSAVRDEVLVRLPGRMQADYAMARTPVVV